MASVKFSSIIKTVKIIMAKHSPEILTGVGIAGMITTTVLAVKAVLVVTAAGNVPVCKGTIWRKFIQR